MKIKLKKQKNSSNGALVKARTEVSRFGSLDDVRLDPTIMDAASYLQVPAFFIVESYITERCSSKLTMFICENPPLRQALAAIRDNRDLCKQITTQYGSMLTSRERRLIESRHIDAMIIPRAGELIESLFESAKGVSVRGYDKKGDEKIYDVAPSVEAAKYLLDRVVGKPISTVEGDITGKGTTVQNVIILPSNGRGDEKLQEGRNTVIDAEFIEDVQNARNGT